MACCQKQTPPRDDRELPKPTIRDQNQLVLAFTPLGGVLGSEAGHGSAIAALLNTLESRLAPPTLQSQHVCMQI